MWVIYAAYVDPNEGRREAVQFLAIPFGLDEFPSGLSRKYPDQTDAASAQGALPNFRSYGDILRHINQCFETPL
jgi:hypothetical protein